MGQAAPKIEYCPRQPEKGVLHRVVRDHLSDLLAQIARRFEDGLPPFVELELTKFLGCGHLATGFARLKCQDCGNERLVAFSCKRRSICPSCAGRRMAQRAAHLVDRVFPVVPVRQWVLSLPFALRYKMAWDHELALRVLGIFWRCVDRYYRNKAKEKGIEGAQTGGVTVIQRAGGALNVNPHFHTAALDGVFTRDEQGKLTFHRLGAPTTEEVAAVAKEARKRVLKMLGRDKVSYDEEEDAWNDGLFETSPALAAATASSVYQTVAFGVRAGRQVMRIIDPVPDAAAERGKVISRRKRHARYQGFDLHVGAAVPGKDRHRLEKLLRYLLRPPVAEGRLSELPNGNIALKLKSSWKDGTRVIVFTPLEFLEKIIAIIPKPHANQIIYHGVLGARHKWRKQVVAYGRTQEEIEAQGNGAVDPDAPYYIDWATLMKRTFGIDVLACEKCGGLMRIIALIDQPPVIKKILEHLGLPTEPPKPKPARAPPREDPEETEDDFSQLEIDFEDLDGLDDPDMYAE